MRKSIFHIDMAIGSLVRGTMLGMHVAQKQDGDWPR